MNLGSEKRSPNETVAMLKKMNPPPTQAVPRPIPPPEVHSTQEGWSEMLDYLDSLNRHMEMQTSYLKQLSERPMRYPTRTQMDDLLKRTAHLEQMVEQAGKKKERRFSLSKISLPDLSDISWSPLMILIPMLLLAFFAGWYSLGKLWNEFGQMLP